MILKSLWNYGLGIVLISFLFCGCAKLVATPEPVTLSFGYPDYDDMGQYSQWAQQFQEQHPHITVELKSMDNFSPSRVAEVDAFLGSQMMFLEYLDRQIALNLSSFIEQDEDLNLADFYPNAVNVFTTEGKHWALPYGINMMMVYYNKDIFDQYGVAYPEVGWNWGEFLDCAMGTTSMSQDTFGFGMQYSGEFAIFEPVMFIYQHGGRVFDDLQNPTRVTLNEPLTIEAMEFYASLIFDHQVAPTWDLGPRLRPSAYPWAGVIQGRYAMWTTMLSDRGGENWPRAWEMNWGMVPLPHDQAEATLALADGLFISANTQHPDAAWLWIEFLSRQMPPFTLPARRSLAESIAYEQQVGMETAEVARAAMEGAVLVNPNLLGFEKALGAMEQAFEAIRKGEATPEESLNAAQEASGF